VRVFTFLALCGPEMLIQCVDLRSTHPQFVRHARLSGGDEVHRLELAQDLGLGDRYVFVG